MKCLPLILDVASFIDNGVTLMANILPHAAGLLIGITDTAQGPSRILDKSRVSERSSTDLTAETVRMPAAVEGLDYTTYDKLPTFATAWRKEHVKIMFTVLPAFVLIEDSLGKGLEALGTYKALWVPDFPVRVDDLLVSAEPLPTPATHPDSHRHVRTIFLCWEWRRGRRRVI